MPICGSNGHCGAAAQGSQSVSKLHVCLEFHCILTRARVDSRVNAQERDVDHVIQGGALCNQGVGNGISTGAGIAVRRGAIRACASGWNEGFSFCSNRSNQACCQGCSWHGCSWHESRFHGIKHGLKGCAFAAALLHWGSMRSFAGRLRHQAADRACAACWTTRHQTRFCTGAEHEHVNFVDTGASSGINQHAACAWKARQAHRASARLGGTRRWIAVCAPASGHGRCANHDPALQRRYPR